MIGTITNVAVGSGLKIAGYVLGRLVDAYFENKRLQVAALSRKYDLLRDLNSGPDTADDFTKHTRRVLAWMFAFTACFILVLFALDPATYVTFLTSHDGGLFGWIFGGSDQVKVEVSKAQMIMNMWPLLEILFGFYFTKVGGRSS